MLQQRIIGLPRRAKLFLAMAVDAMVIVVAVWGAFALRLSDPWPEMLSSRWWLLLTMPVVTLAVFKLVKLYQGVLRHIGAQFAVALFYGVSISALFMPLMVLLAQQASDFSRAVSVMYWFLAVVGVGGIRMVGRGWFRHGAQTGARPVIIYGSGDAGAQLQTALTNGSQFKLVGFVDDDKSRWNMLVNGVRVHDPAGIRRLILANRCRDVLLAVPSSTRVQRREIIERLRPLPVTVRTVPSLTELVEGRISVDEIRPIAVEDLLGRDSVEPKQELLDRCIRGRVVMVTGAGGSIGSELCRQIIHLKPRKLLLFERSEYSLYQIHAELKAVAEEERLGCDITPILGSIGDQTHVSHVLGSFDVDTIYHAAAYKHVPMVEYNVASGVLNNSLSTLVLAEAAIATGVDSFVLVSTDKAVRPTNVMGASKRLAELILQALHLRGSSTRFCMVRFGNVLDSSGSVVPIFKKQIAEGGPMSVTHPDVIRYFMTIPEAAALVLQAGSMGTGGDVFLLDMGDAVKIADLARLMIRLAGLTERTKERPGGDIEIAFTGLRPGEKLYEELLIGEDVLQTDHPMIMRGNEESIPWDQLEAVLIDLETACRTGDIPMVIDLLQRAVSGFKPMSENSDLLWRIQGQAAVADPSVSTD